MKSVNESSVIDPVCGMMIDSKTAKGGSSIYNNVTHYFCNPKCKTKFDEDPIKFLKLTPSQSSDLKNVEFTCPMHPEIRQIGPGSCRICGMALEPLNISLDHPEDMHEYLLMRNRFWLSAALSIPLLFITMGGRHLINNPEILEKLPWVELVLATPVVLCVVGRFLSDFGSRLKTEI